MIRKRVFEFMFSIDYTVGLSAFARRLSWQGRLTRRSVSCESGLQFQSLLSAVFRMILVVDGGDEKSVGVLIMWQAFVELQGRLVETTSKLKQVRGWESGRRGWCGPISGWEVIVHC